jgi:hypothetical protein
LAVTPEIGHDDAVALGQHFSDREPEGMMDGGGVEQDYVLPLSDDIRKELRSA